MNEEGLSSRDLYIRKAKEIFVDAATHAQVGGGGSAHKERKTAKVEVKETERR